MSNPLLEANPLPPFSRIKPEHAEPAIRQLIARNKDRIEQLLDEHESYSWENLLAPIEQLDDELSQAFSPISHLNSVCNSEAMREAYNACLPKLSVHRRSVFCLLSLIVLTASAQPPRSQISLWNP